MAYTAIPASNASTGCLETLIETKSISGADANTMTFSGLSGDTDGFYELEGSGRAGANCTIRGGTLNCYFNGVTTNQAFEADVNLSTTGGSLAWGGGSGSTLAILAYEAAAGKGWHFRARIYPKTGIDRRIEFACSASHSSTPVSNHYLAGVSYWYDTATVVTSLVLSDPTHNFFGIDSIVTLRKISLT